MDTKIDFFKEWIKHNRYYLFLIFAIYQICIMSIGIINYPYIDDISRQQNGSTGFAWSYSRWGSEIFSWFVQGSQHLTDQGLTTHILTGIILAVASIIAVYVLNDGKLTVLTLLSSALIGLNPWFLQCVSFRFDSPYMALSILFSSLPFLWWKKNKVFFVGISIVSVFLCAILIKLHQEYIL